MRGWLGENEERNEATKEKDVRGDGEFLGFVSWVTQRATEVGEYVSRVQQLLVLMDQASNTKNPRFPHKEANWNLLIDSTRFANAHVFQILPCRVHKLSVNQQAKLTADDITRVILHKGVESGAAERGCSFF